MTPRGLLAPTTRSPLNVSPGQAQRGGRQGARVRSLGPFPVSLRVIGSEWLAVMFGLALLAVSAGVAAGTSPGTSPGTVGSPLAVGNIGPIAGLYGLPRMQGAMRVTGRDFSLATDLANNFSAGMENGREVAFDGETRRFAAAWRWPLGHDREAGIEVSWIEHTGGGTDALVAGFHDAFGMPDGGRDQARRNQLDYRLSVAGREVFALDDMTDGLGDIRLWGGWQWFQQPGRAAALRLQLKLPTGDVDRLTSSGAMDASLWMEYGDAALFEWLGVKLTLGGGVAWLGNGRLEDAAQESSAWIGHLGLQYPVTGRVTLLAQLDGHTRLLDTGFDKVGGEGLLGAAGTRIQIGRASDLELAIIEDLRTTTAPDVTFQLKWRWRP